MTKLRIDLPPDVIEILGKVGPKTIDEAITHLVRSYDAFLDEGGELESQPVVIPPDDTLPTVEELEAAVEQKTQPDAGDVVVQERKGPPRDKDGLISVKYLKSKGVYLTPGQTHEHWQAIREVCSRVPEDLWATEKTVHMIEERATELIKENSK